MDTVARAGDNRIFLLRSDVGLGRMFALSSLVGTVVAQVPGARVLILCHAGLKAQWVDVLTRNGTAAVIADRYWLRERMDHEPGEALFPHAAATVMSVHFAKQDDVASALASIHWNLVIADDGHQIAGASSDLLRRVCSTAVKLVVATTTHVEPPAWLPAQRLKVVEWRRDQLLGHDGKRLDATPRPLVLPVTYVLTAAEADLSQMVLELSDLLRDGSRARAWASTALRWAGMSSPAALENSLRKYAVAQSTLASEPVPDDLEALEDAQQISTWQAPEGVRSLARATLAKLEANERDSKLLSLLAILRGLHAAPSRSGRTCVVTDYVNTVFYLGAALEDAGLTCEVLHGRMSFEARHTVLQEAREGRCILVATRGMLGEGLSLPEIDDLVLYDVPRSPLQVAQLVGRFDRFGRTSQLRIHIPVESGGILEALGHRMAADLSGSGWDGLTAGGSPEWRAFAGNDQSKEDDAEPEV